jgi:3-phenylpropionate/trans-cinnamate dioxygenase ferredoxin component
MSRFSVAAKISDVPDRSVKLVELEGRSIALFNLGGEFFALDDLCTHEGGPLSEGLVDGEEIECPWHGARFEIRSGKAALDPATENVGRYNVRVTGSDIEIEI